VLFLKQAQMQKKIKNLNFLEKERAKFFVCILESLRSAQILNFCSQMKFELFQLEIGKKSALKDLMKQEYRKTKLKQKNQFP
jgi:hypothetical protein